MTNTTSPSLDECRKAFEHEFNAAPYRTTEGGYRDSWKQAMWIGYQAAWQARTDQGKQQVDEEPQFEERTDLVSCPFCGESRLYLNRAKDGGINCPSCLARMPNECNDAEELIGCWNHREPEQDPIAPTAHPSQLNVDAVVEKLEAEMKPDFQLDSKEFWWNAGLQKAATIIRTQADEAKEGK